MAGALVLVLGLAANGAWAQGGAMRSGDAGDVGGFATGSGHGPTAGPDAGPDADVDDDDQDDGGHTTDGPEGLPDDQPGPATPGDADDAPGLIEAPEGAAAMAGPADDGYHWGEPAAQTGATAAATAPAIRTAPVVVELFTSQGCSTCPPADRMLAGLTGQRDVLALAWHVDYWDYLGWADAFARPDHARRQQGYALAAGERGVYTPQMIVDGQDTLITARPADLMAIIAEHRARPAAIMVTATSEGVRQQIQLTPRAVIPGGVTVLLVRYAPKRTVAVKAGENRGQTLSYANVVLDSRVLARWDARAPLRLTIEPGQMTDPAFPSDTRHAILAQQALPGNPPLPGPILAALVLE